MFWSLLFGLWNLIWYIFFIKFSLCNFLCFLCNFLLCLCNSLYDFFNICIVQFALCNVICATCLSQIALGHSFRSICLCYLIGATRFVDLDFTCFQIKLKDSKSATTETRLRSKVLSLESLWTWNFTSLHPER